MSNLNLNKVVLAGRLVATPELKQTTSGVAVVGFSIAVNRRRVADRDQEVDFINCIAWRQTAEFIAKYFRKGSAICVTGSIQTRSWTDKQGHKKYATEVVIDDAMFVDGKKEIDAPAPYIPEAHTAAPDRNDTDDDLPF